jgi:hypothetical protein
LEKHAINVILENGQMERIALAKAVSKERTTILKILDVYRVLLVDIAKPLKPVLQKLALYVVEESLVLQLAQIKKKCALHVRWVEHIISLAKRLY